MEYARKFLFFDSGFLLPKVITFLYWLALLGIFISSVIMMFNNFLVGFLMLLGSAIVARIVCELYMVIFKIHENLEKIANKP